MRVKRKLFQNDGQTQNCFHHREMLPDAHSRTSSKRHVSEWALGLVVQPAFRSEIVGATVPPVIPMQSVNAEPDLCPIRRLSAQAPDRRIETHRFFYNGRQIP